MEGQLLGALLLDQPHTAIAMIALLRGIEHAGARPDADQLCILPEHQKVLLEGLDITAGVDAVQTGEHLRQGAVIPLIAVKVAHLPALVHRAGKNKLPVLKRRELFTKFPLPRSKTLIGADLFLGMETDEILIRDLHRHGDLDILLFFIKILFRHLIRAKDQADRVQDTGLSCIVLAH